MCESAVWEVNDYSQNERDEKKNNCQTEIYIFNKRVNRGRESSTINRYGGWGKNIVGKRSKKKAYHSATHMEKYAAPLQKQQRHATTQLIWAARLSSIHPPTTAHDTHITHMLRWRWWYSQLSNHPPSSHQNLPLTLKTSSQWFFLLFFAFNREWEQGLLFWGG